MISTSSDVWTTALPRAAPTSFFRESTIVNEERMEKTLGIAGQRLLTLMQVQLSFQDGGRF